MSQEGVTGVLFVDQHGLCITGNFLFIKKNS